MQKDCEMALVKIHFIGFIMEKIYFIKITMFSFQLKSRNEYHKNSIIVGHFEIHLFHFRNRNFNYRIRKIQKHKKI